VQKFVKTSEDICVEFGNCSKKQTFIVPVLSTIILGKDGVRRAAALV
jgi:hypothetical protein